MALITCPHCGLTNREGSNFCNGCGADLRDDQPQRPARSRPVGLQRLRKPRTPAPSSADESSSAASPAQTPLEEKREPAEPTQSVPDSQPQDALSPLDMPGLLEPVTLSSRVPEEALPAPPLLDPAAGVDLAQLGQIRRQMAGDLPLANTPAAFALTRGPALRIGWISLLLGLTLAVPALFSLSAPPGPTATWPGVTAAHAAITRLPRAATVLVFWAYDPATAGELDMVMRPVLNSLLERNARLVGISLLPNGPATAQRLYDQLQPEAAAAGRAAAVPALRVQFLSGGAAALPLAGQDLAWLTGDDPGIPQLAVVAAAQAESVQEWLEQVQPLNRVPVIAVTGAGAAPLLQTYLDSGQLIGLVSGFDGAAAYGGADAYGGAGQTPVAPAPQRMHQNPTFQPSNVPTFQPITPARQRVYQNWATVAILFILAAGNLVSLSGRAQDQA